jgi:hypothetical protein
MANKELYPQITQITQIKIREQEEETRTKNQ